MKSVIFVAFLLIAATYGQTCAECEQLVGAIEVWVENNATTQQIIQYLDQYCNLNPQLELECEALVSYGIPYVITWLQKNQYTPQQVCALLRVCSVEQKPIKTNADPYCAYCTTVISSIETYLEANATQEEIIQKVDQLCQLLPSGFSLYCEVFIQNDLPSIIGYLNQNYTPQQVCTKIGLCSALKSQKIGGIHKIIKN